jgi:preprotein translocase subunit SecE
VARDRKRAKQRRDRRTGPGTRGRSSATGGRPAPEPASPPTREDVPGALDHASSDADEFDAALVRGAGGVTATPEADDASADGDLGDGLVEPAGVAQEPGPSGGATLAAESGLQLDDAIGQRVGSGGAVAGAVARPAAREHVPAAPRGGSRVVAFLEASWAELQRVQWPDRRQVVQATAVVLGFVIVAGLYLGLADLVAKEIVEFVL